MSMSKSAIDIFPPALHRMLSVRVVQGRTREFPLVGASTLNNLFVLANMLRELRPKRTLEIGLACGTSALVFASAHRLVGDGAERIHVAIDPFQSDLDDAGLAQIESEGLTRYFQFMREPSYVALPKLLRDEISFDIIYIDGSHHFEHVFIDIFYSSRLLSEGGIVLFDDSAWPEVRKVVKFVRGNLAHALTEIDLARYRKDDRRDLRYKVAGIFGRKQLTGFKKIADPQRAVTSVMRSF